MQKDDSSESIEREREKERERERVTDSKTKLHALDIS